MLIMGLVRVPGHAFNPIAHGHCKGVQTVIECQGPTGCPLFLVSLVIGPLARIYERPQKLHAIPTSLLRLVA
jgi:hypothetical protein